MLASYLYRFKDAITYKTKALGYVFVVVLMLITSLGIYGYLAEAYQAGSTDMKQVNASMDLKKQEQATLQKRKGEIDAQIAQVPVKDVRGKQRLMKQFGPEVNTINTRLIALTSEVQVEAQKQITTDSHVGPIVFVAKIVGIEPDNAISLLILAIVFAFDPLAIYLTIACNTAIAKYKAKKAEPEDEPPMEDYWSTDPDPVHTADFRKEFVDKFKADMGDTILDVKLAEQQDDNPEHIDLLIKPIPAAEYVTMPPMGDLSEFVEVDALPEPLTFPEIDLDLPGVPLVEEDTIHVPEEIVKRAADIDVVGATFDDSMSTDEVHEKFNQLVKESRARLVSPGVPVIMTEVNEWWDGMKRPREPIADMKALGELFSKEETEDVTFEEGTEAPPVQQLVKIYEETAAKDVAEQTPMDIETMDRITRFFKRQELIKNVRSGTVE